MYLFQAFGHRMGYFRVSRSLPLRLSLFALYPRSRALKIYDLKISCGAQAMESQLTTYVTGDTEFHGRKWRERRLSSLVHLVIPSAIVLLNTRGISL